MSNYPNDDIFPGAMQPQPYDPASTWITPAAEGGTAARRRSAKRVSRRQLLIGAGAVGVGAVALTSGILYTRRAGHLPLQASSPAGNSQITHLLRRAGFSAQAGEIATYAAMGFTGAVDHLLNYASVPDDLDNRLAALNLDLTTIQDQQRWWVLRMIYSKHPFEEKMTLFWHGLLTSSYTKVGGRTNYGYLIQQNKFLRTHALDTFDNILLGITSDPAMMWWLDLRLSRKTAPNENYARELMELFTLGVSGGYTQSDVHDAARALTGWRLQNGAQTATYDPTQHDGTAKTLLGQSGNFDYHDVIRILAAHPAAAPYLSRRLFEFFVHANPSDAEIAPMVDAYNKHQHSIAAVMRAMFLSPAFLAAASYRSRVKSPSEFVVGLIRQLEIDTTGQGIAAAIAVMDQTLFNPPNVAGWPGDVQSEQWVNTGTWLYRVNLVNTILEGATGKATNAAANTYIQTLITKNNLSSPDAFIDHFAALLIDGQLASDQRQAIKTYLTATGSGATLTYAGGSPVPAANVHGALYLLLASPQYQLN